MKLEIIISSVLFVISSVLFIISWFATNWLTSKREYDNKKREIKIQYLIGAYRSIASAANRQGTMTNDQKLKIESAIDDIQLLGNETELNSLNNMISSRNSNFTEILEILRNDLRQELELKKVDYPLKFYRMNRD